MSSPVIVVHGGAGAWRHEGAERVHASLRDALEAGGGVLFEGGSALDAVQAAVEVLEDAPSFNAGRGAVTTAADTVEHDAALMDGRTRRAGAVAAVCGVLHPVTLARAVMERSPHVLLVGRGAESFAHDLGLDRVDQDTLRRASTRSGPEPIPRDMLSRLRRAGRAAARDASEVPIEESETVGAVALDELGHLAAATSTGGMRDQLPGRVGDAPIIGAGTYAEDGICAVSATGDGEAFITAVAAHEAAMLVRIGGLDVAEACSLVLRSRVSGTGGMIAVAPGGAVAMPFTTPAMARGVLRAGKEPWTAIGRQPGAAP